MVADHRGTGTTSLTVTGTTPLVAAFGQRSAQKHRAAGAVLLNEQLAGAVRGLECDVDTRADLEAAERLGLGQRTAEVLRWLGSRA
jgi:2-phospho-L-lactate guanylyltransferase